MSFGIEVLAGVLVDMPISVLLNVDMKSSVTGGMSIGEVAGRFGLATHVLRHWESMGLLEPARAAGDRRRYRDTDLYRIAVILRAKEAGMELTEIHEMLTARDPAQRRAVLDRRRADLVRRIATLQTSLELVDGALQCDHEDFTECERFQRFVAERIDIDLRTV
jgi:MerR family transcriptional regulator, copper efflux regulator